MEFGTVRLKGKLRSEFGNAMSYRALKRENPEMAAEWRKIGRDIRAEFKAAEEEFLSAGDPTRKALLLFSVLDHAADKARHFNRVSGLMAEMHAEVIYGGKPVIKFVSKHETTTVLKDFII